MLEFVETATGSGMSRAIIQRRMRTSMVDQPANRWMAVVLFYIACESDLMGSKNTGLAVGNANPKYIREPQHLWVAWIIMLIVLHHCCELLIDVMRLITFQYNHQWKRVGSRCLWVKRGQELEKSFARVQKPLHIKCCLLVSNVDRDIINFCQAPSTAQMHAAKSNIPNNQKSSLFRICCQSNRYRSRS